MSRAWFYFAPVIVVALTACSPAGPTPPGGQDDGLPDTTITSSPGDDAVVRRTDFQITYKLDGVSLSGSFVELISNRQLSFVATATVDMEVAEGQTVGSTTVDPLVEAALEASSATSAVDEGRLGQLRELEGAVVAPIGGIFGFVGDLPVVHTPGIDVVVDLSPIQDLRYQSLQFTGRAVIETVVGQREVACVAIWTEQSDVGADVADDGTPSASSKLHCRLPGYVETAPGLRAQVILMSRLLEDVIVVPNIYVGYDATVDGYFIKVRENGATSTIPVVVGVTDGVVRVITSDTPLGGVLVLPEES